jgi:hypothetical protein
MSLGTTKAEREAYDRIYSVIGDCDAIQLDHYLAEYRAAAIAASSTPKNFVFAVAEAWRIPQICDWLARQIQRVNRRP